MVRSCLDMFIFIKGFRTIVFIFIISTMFWLMSSGLLQVFVELGNLHRISNCPLLNPQGSRSDSVNHNQVQVLKLSVLLLTRSQDWTCNLQMIVSLEA